VVVLGFCCWGFFGWVWVFFLFLVVWLGGVGFVVVGGVVFCGVCCFFFLFVGWFWVLLFFFCVVVWVVGGWVVGGVWFLGFLWGGVVWVFCFWGFFFFL